jgi:predicted Zn-dependent protease
MSIVSVGFYDPLYARGAIGPVSEIIASIAVKAPEALVVYLMTAAMGAYSQAQETEADRVGLAVMQRAGYNPAAALTVMEKFAEVWHTR